MDIPVKFLMKLIPLLPLGAAGELARLIDSGRSKNVMKVCKFRAKGDVTVTGKDVTVTENVTVTEKKCNGYISKTAEISQKTQFSAENSVRVGGVGGGVHTAFDVPGYNSTQFNSKEKNNFEKIFSGKKLTEWKKMEKLARPYWILMPGECREKSSFKKFTIVYNKLRKGKDVPELWAFLGVLHKKLSTLNKGFLPAADKFLDDEQWRDLLPAEVDAISRNRASLQKQAEKTIAEFDGKEAT